MFIFTHFIYFLKPGIIFLFSALLLSSCATNSAYYQSLNRMTAAGQFSEAAGLAEKSRDKVYGGRDLLLYYFDRGMLLHLAGSIGDNLVPGIELDAKTRVRQDFGDETFELDELFFCHCWFLSARYRSAILAV